MIDPSRLPGSNDAPGETSSDGCRDGALSPPAETIADMTLAQVLATPLGDLVRMLMDGAPARPKAAAKLSQAEIDRVDQRAKEAVRALRIARARRP